MMSARVSWLRGSMAVLLAVVAICAPAGAAAGQSAPAPTDDTACVGSDCPAAAGDATASADKPAPKPKTIAEFVKDKQRLDGLFPMYRDAVSGTLFMEISAAQLSEQFIYYTFVRNGVSGLLAQLGDLRFAGQVGDNFTVRFRQRFNRVDVIRENLAFTMDPDSPLNRAFGANAGDSVMARLTIVARDADDRRLIVAANPLFIGTDLFRIGNASPLLAAAGLNPTLSKTKTALQEVRNYPANASIITEYVFDFKTGPQPVSIELQHNLVKVPGPGFAQRRYDPRVGLIPVRKTNLDRIEGSQIDDVIQRWRLEKQDPAASLSPPVKPIIFWIQNSTPRAYRDVIKQAVLHWNPAFEAAGFRNAIEVRQQGDDADWDAGDIRYNLIQWIASPTPLFNGYGPSVIDPRTGEILAANIVLEHGSLRSQQLLESTLPGDLPPPSAPAAHMAQDCAMSDPLRAEVALALAAVQTGDGALDALAADRILRQRLTYLVMHEIGHTLGLAHNMKGSVYRSVAELQGDLAPDAPISGSVMDYPAANLLGLDRPNRQVFPTTLGPYDHWAIAFAYDPRLTDAAEREALLAKAGQPGLLFGIDAEDMRAVGRGIDPRVIPFDMSSDPLTFAERQMRLLRDVQLGLPAKLGRGPHALDQFVETHRLLTSLYQQQAIVVSRYVGGVFDERDRVINGGGPGPALVPVNRTTQQRAVAILNEFLFAPDALLLPAAYQQNLVLARRGQSGIDFANQLDDVLQLQMNMFDHLLHPDTLERVGGVAALNAGWSVDDMLDDVTAAVFDADLKGPVISQRRALQERYAGLLIRSYQSGSAAMTPFRAPMLRQIQAIDRKLKQGPMARDTATRASRQLIRNDIRKALEIDQMPR